jgi:hypothetical protein
VYAEIYPFLKTTVLAWADFGKITMNGVLGVSPWAVIIVFVTVVIGVFRWFESRGL